MKVLFVDDNELDLPSDVVKQYYLEHFGVESINACPEDPISSALDILRSHVVTGVLTDSCRRLDYSHLAEFRKEQPHLLIGLRSSALTNADRERAFRAGADICIDKGEPTNLQGFLGIAGDPYRAAQRRFLSELPSLLTQPELRGKWVAYTVDGRQGQPADDDLTLVRRFISGDNAKRFFFARVLPDMQESIVSRSGQVEDAV